MRGKIDREATFSLQSVDQFGNQRAQTATKAGGLKDSIATYALQGVGTDGIRNVDILGVRGLTADATTTESSTDRVGVDATIEWI